MVSQTENRTLKSPGALSFAIAHNQWIYLICLAGLLLRFGYVLTLDPYIVDNGDGADYSHHALVLLKGEEYPRQGAQPFMRPPLYVFWLAGFYALQGGPVEGSNPNLLWIRFSQAFIDIGTCFVLFHIARLIWNPLIALVSAAFYAFNPFFIFFSARIRVEVLFGLLVALMVLCLVYLYVHNFSRPWLLALAGVFGGLASLARPNLLAFAPLAVLWLILVFYSRWKTLLVYSSLLALGWIVAILPWTIHNYSAYHEFILVTDGFGYNFWCSNAEPKLADQQASTTTEYQAADSYHWRLMRQHENEMATFTPKEKERAYLDMAILFIRQHTSTWLLMTGRKVLEFWSPTVRPDVHGAEAALIGLPFGLFMLFGLVAFVLAFWDHSIDWSLWWLFAFLFFSAAIVGIFFWATPRYRIPMVDPYLIPFGVSWITSRILRQA